MSPFPDALFVSSRTGMFLSNFFIQLAWKQSELLKLIAMHFELKLFTATYQSLIQMLTCLGMAQLVVEQW